MAITLAMNSPAQQWVKQSDCSGTIRYETINFVVNDQAFDVGGLISLGGNFTAYDEVYRYNDTNDTWTKVSNYPGGNIYDGIGFVIDSMAYVGLGSDESGFRSGLLYAYNSRTDTWTQKKSFPAMERTNAFSFVLNGKAYVGCGDNYIGQNRMYLSDVWEYDPISNSWTQLGDFTGGGRVGMTATVVGNKAYVGMGDDGSFFYNSFFEYDQANDDWISRATFPGSNRSFYGATSAMGKLFILGGEDLSSAYTNEMWSYNPSNDSWQSETDFTGTARVAATMFYLHGSFYYGMGLIGSSSAQGAKDIWKLEISGLGEKDYENLSFSLYPNPSHGIFNIQWENSNLQHSIEFLSTNGQLLKEWKVDNTGSTVLDLRSFSPGLYYLKLSNDKMYSVEPIMIE